MCLNKKKKKTYLSLWWLRSPPVCSGGVPHMLFMWDASAIEVFYSCVSVCACVCMGTRRQPDTSEHLQPWQPLPAYSKRHTCKGKTQEGHEVWLCMLHRLIETGDLQILVSSGRNVTGCHIGHTESSREVKPFTEGVNFLLDNRVELHPRADEVTIASFQCGLILPVGGLCCILIKSYSIWLMVMVKNKYTLCELIIINHINGRRSEEEQKEYCNTGEAEGEHRFTCVTGLQWNFKWNIVVKSLINSRSTSHIWINMTIQVFLCS